MIRLVGSSAHSQFRLKQLLLKLQSSAASLERLTQVQSHYEYFVSCHEDLTLNERELLKEVLEAKETSLFESPLILWVVPRFGTQSAWGSKAADILHHVGLNKIDRLERAVVYAFDFHHPKNIAPDELKSIQHEIHDRMIETVVDNWQAIAALFDHHSPRPLHTIPLLENGKTALQSANTIMGLALSTEEIDYLEKQYLALERDPTDVELMMFAQANSEHCRHKIFNAQWEIDGQIKEDTLFGMIKNTYQHHSEGVLSAYHDNAAVIRGLGQKRFYCSPRDHVYRNHDEEVHFVIKVETHNHPTAIEPFAGAGTGQGGEIRDEGATGCGAKPKAGLTGFTVSNLHIPQFQQPWEGSAHYPTRIATALEIMLKAPIGGAAFNNEFGRPNLCGYFRTFEQSYPHEKHYFARGYHKPIMLAGGLGNIAFSHIQKKPIPEGALIVVLGGPALSVGLGGGAASSMTAGESAEELDFASVQRQNPEMERRCQEVIDRCTALDKDNPIISIHDVGA
ncbi:MAG: AIR synthase-related protein, partial [Candidatus Berkiellales bacterium]